MYAWLQDAIVADSEVVTASRRLARELRTCYDEAQIASGSTSWLTPRITAWPDWLKEKLDSCPDAATLPDSLDTNSAAVVWSNCLQEHVADSVLNLPGITRQSQRAWQLVCDWLVPIEECLATARSPDERLFARTAARYRATLDASGWIDNAGMAALLRGLVRKGAIQLPERIVLAGFDRQVPAVALLAAALRDAGSAVATAPAATGNAGVQLAEFENFAEEMRSAGAWSRSILTNNATARLAIVCPELDSNADSTRRLVLEGLAPGWQQGGNRYSNVINVAYGRKLTDFAAIHIALLLLRWAGTGLTSREISVVLRSKCVGSGSIAGRSRLEYVLRSLPARNWSVAAFRRILQGRARGEDVAPFFDALQKIQELSADMRTRRWPAEWAASFDSLLHELRWPGEQTLKSDEFQLVNRWRRLLNEFARTGIVAPQVSLAEAVQRLSTIAANTIFQAEAAHASVQVLGTLEGAGMQFDGVWISGLDAAQWPPRARPSPFLARALQKKYAMPDATPADTLGFAKLVLNRLVAAGPHCVASWSRIRDDSELGPSPLLDELQTQEYAGPRDPGWHASCAVGVDAVEVRNDDSVPAVHAGEVLRGGAYTIQRQYVQPLEAFVTGRLGVVFPQTIEPGLSARVRGNILHDALHNLLAEKPAQAEIRNWTTEQRLQKTGSAIDAALAKPIAYADTALEHVLAMERQRLQSIIDEFLNSECARSDFHIKHVEAEIRFRRGNIDLGLRADRIDRLADGSLLIIDYKTGAPKNFLGRDGIPVDLQLVVYADALEAEIGGLSLINIDSRQISYKGAGGAIEWDPERGENWRERIDAWTSIVRRTAEEFAAGDVRINLSLPVKDSGALRILSRHEELRRAD